MQSPRRKRSAESAPPRLTFDTYLPLADIADELLGRDGHARPHWTRFFEALEGLAPGELERGFAAADRHIRDMGVSYRAYGEKNDRPWPLSYLPVLIPENEWRTIEAGVRQRAELLEQVLADIYGEGQLVRDGALPAAAITGSPDYLRPLVGVNPPGGRFLNLYAADLGRGPDGRWWVLSDRSQAPSGMGYALENRLVSSRAFPELYRQMNVERLAPFFREFKDGLTASAERSEPRICLLTPGPFSETYFEQAHLARYLGFLLVEGADLVVRDGLAHVRTIAGLKRADVIWRRIDADFADPLELNATSRLGASGLVDAIRGGKVVVANALGSGVVESPALMSFLPQLSRRLMDTELTLPNIATWWCGQSRERRDVLERLDQLTIAGAFGRGVPGFSVTQPVIAGEVDAEAKPRLIRLIEERGIDFVGQELVKLSTTPVFENGTLVPRPFVLRVYATVGADGNWQVMMGGFCRISDRLDARAVSMGEGVQSADVWVLADKPVDKFTLLPAPDKIAIRRTYGVLPSRAADNLFWLGRYLERCEATLRIARCLASRLIDADAMRGDVAGTVTRLERMLAAWGAQPVKAVGKNSRGFLLGAVTDDSDECYGSALSLANEAVRTASSIRERLSSDMWRLIGTAQARLAHVDSDSHEIDVEQRLERTLQILDAIAGLAKENMNRLAGWHFLDLGKRIERGVNTFRFARNFALHGATADDLEVALDLIDSQITYRTRYTGGVAPAPVRDMALLDPFNPRSAAFQIKLIDEHLSTLPVIDDNGILEQPRKLAVKLASDIAVIDAMTLDGRQILGFENNLMGLANAIAARYFLQGPNAPRATRQIGLA
ncbi:MAG: circularly permuted type 2 ATP-grasp protein [Methylobacteriaceae bacterium]|nr:circularly permuted type 2 ATP-grasp protein [Methylobacteriaceae bacterium]